MKPLYLDVLRARIKGSLVDRKAPIRRSRGSKVRSGKGVTSQSVGVADDMPPGAVFISYAHEDLPAVQNLYENLRAQGLDVWFDDPALQSGDRFEYRIRSYIEEQCSCFLMVLSQNTEKRLDAYFRREWSSAIDRDKGVANTVTFIMPVAIDGTDPKHFKTLHRKSKNTRSNACRAGK